MFKVKKKGLNDKVREKKHKRKREATRRTEDKGHAAANPTLIMCHNTHIYKHIHHEVEQTNLSDPYLHIRCKYNSSGEKHR